jgi:hypothetical protein
MIKTIKMSTTKKFKFYLNGVEFILQRKYLKEFNYDGTPIKEPYIDGGRVPAASIIKQYAKKKYPNVTVSTKSDSFSMGNSVDVYLSDEKGNSVDEKIYKDVSSFAKMFQYGYFNGMEDIYEMRKTDMSSEKGTKIDPGVKFVHVQNRPMFGTVASIVQMLTEYMTTNTYSDGGMLSLEDSIKRVNTYKLSQRNMEKAILILNS